MPDPTKDKVLIDKALEVIENAKILLTNRHAFYGHILLTLHLEPTFDMPTLATDCINTLFFNPNYVLENNLQHIQFACIHEINHIIRLHSKRINARDATLWNVATDLIVNSDIMESAQSMHYDYNLGGGLFDRKYQGWLEEDTYDDLRNKYKNMMDNIAAMFKPIDNHGQWKLPTPQDEQKVRETVQNAAAQWEKCEHRGDLPGGIKKLIDKLKNPRVSWRAQLRQFLGTAVQKTQYTYRSFRKEYVAIGVYKPVLRNPGIGKVVVAVDTSGSCDGLEMVFASEFQTLYDLIDEVILIMADADIQDVIETKDILSALKDHGFKGGGGTSHVPVFNYLKDNGVFPDVMICFTDGYTEFPDQQPPFPTIWCMPEGTDVKVPFGMTVLIPQPDKLDDAVNGN